MPDSECEVKIRIVEICADKKISDTLSCRIYRQRFLPLN